MKKIDESANQVIFEYRFNDLFSNCCTKIAYKSRNAVEDVRVSDEITLSDDDKTIFEANIPFILADIYERILKLTSGITNAYSFEDEVKKETGDDGKETEVKTGDKIISFNFQDNGAYNPNVLDVLDMSLYECLEKGSIKAWYDVCGVAAIEQDYNTKYLASLTELSRRMFQLKKKTIKSTLGDIPATE